MPMVHCTCTSYGANISTAPQVSAVAVNHFWLHRWRGSLVFLFQTEIKYNHLKYSSGHFAKFCLSFFIVHLFWPVQNHKLSVQKGQMGCYRWNTSLSLSLIAAGRTRYLVMLGKPLAKAISLMCIVIKAVAKSTTCSHHGHGWYFSSSCGWDYWQ